MVKVDLIIIGNELLNGKISDRNTKQLASILNQNHIDLNQVQIIGDNQEQFNAAIERALASSEVIITSGGLGPTKDDLTKKMFAEYFNKSMSESSSALELSHSLYKNRGREYDKKSLSYHILPEGFSALNNPKGFAPGLYYSHEKKHLFATPGVPHEFSAMVTDEILPLIKTSFKLNQNAYQFIVKTWRAPESKIFNDIDTKLWDSLTVFGQVSSLPHIFGVDIGVTVNGNDDEIKNKTKKLKEVIENSPVVEYVWQIGNLSLAELIVKEATDKRVTIGFAESCTGGLCASMMTDVSGASQVFYGSVVSYANSVKMKSLGVSEQTLKEYGAVSTQTAYEMAIGAKAQLEVDIAIATTGIAGPLGGSAEKPVGTIGIGHACKKNSGSKIYHFSGDREILKQRFANQALITTLELIRAY